MPYFVPIALTVGDISTRFLDFQDDGCRQPGFLKFYILTVETIKIAKLRHLANFRLNGSNLAEIWRFFYFLTWRTSASWIN